MIAYIIQKNKLQKQFKHRENDFLWIQILQRKGKCENISRQSCKSKIIKNNKKDFPFQRY